MKKILFIFALCLATVNISAQRAAVMEFKAGVRISQSDVDGLCGMFTTGFRPSGYTIIERSQIDRIINEQNMQRSNLTESQMIKIGKLLNLSCIVIGDVNVAMGEYNVDVRVVNVESGVVVATAGKAFTGSYGENMRSLAQTLASKIAIKPGQTVQPAPQRPVAQTPAPAPAPAPVSSPEPTILYGYLKVFPNDLGTFDSKPRTIIANINKTQQYGYGSWRLPTKEELNLLKANGLISGGGYMASDGSLNGKVRLVTDKNKGEVLPAVPQGYVDLGLPSGTLWKSQNEAGDFYTYEQAMAKFGNQLPTKEQFKELKSACKWVWNGNGYKVIGPSDEYIVLPADGSRECNGDVYEVGFGGGYWSSTPYDSRDAWVLYFNSSSVEVNDRYRCRGRSVRLVQ